MPTASTMRIGVCPTVSNGRRLQSLMTTGPVRGVGAQLVVLCSVLGVQLFQVPIFLSVLSPEVYGSYLVLIAVPTAAAMADFGLLSASSTRLVALVAQGEYRIARLLFRLTFTIVAAISVTLLVAASIVYSGADLAQPGINSDTAGMVVLLYVIYTVLSLLSSLCEMAMRGNNVYATAWLWTAALRVTEFLACAALLISTSSLTNAVVALVVARAIGVAFFLTMTKSKVSWVSFTPLVTNRDVLRGLLRPTLGSAALPVGNALLNQGLVLAVNAALGPASVVIYTTGRTLMNTSRQVTNAIANGVLPSLTQYTALGKADHMSKVLRRSLFLACSVTAIIGLMLIILGPKIVEIWTLNELFLPTNFIVLLAVLSLPEACWIILSLRLLAANNHFGYSVFYALTAAGVVGTAFAAELRDIETFVAVLIAQSLMMVLVTFIYGKRSLIKT